MKKPLYGSMSVELSSFQELVRKTCRFVDDNRYKIPVEFCVQKTATPSRALEDLRGLFRQEAIFSCVIQKKQESYFLGYQPESVDISERIQWECETGNFDAEVKSSFQALLSSVSLGDGALYAARMRDSGSHYSVLAVFHHIIVDGESIQEFGRRVQASCTASVGEVNFEYFDELRSIKKRESLENGEDYWKSYMKSYRAGRGLSGILSQQLVLARIELENSVDRIFDLCEDLRTTPNVIFHAVVARSYARSIAGVYRPNMLGVPISLRSSRGTVGTLINVLPMRNPAPDADYGQTVIGLNLSYRAHRRFRYYPILELLDWHRKINGPRAPIYEYVYTFIGQLYCFPASRCLEELTTAAEVNIFRYNNSYYIDIRSDCGAVSCSERDAIVSSIVETLRYLSLHVSNVTWYD